ncbi:redoxin domain-containing protein [Mycolicibacterium brumae]|uniref:Thiol:disulfide interchange protein n=1 Tax=Mycolicibacterium brumae TaxID=85968 RepID=A0A2G5P6K4_9MYCO|nr:cytochrome c biogenesis protein CcdA [Mycolicibacterium brumae]MCV7191680.1 redoxin domain-containing protein [Mycolicibacterium brumae]PIB73524.1 thiol:disulfide interchange protein [Mycolicibacterium brumae]RWA20465.1 hypothetical protein MBRU_02075 [Mycolicibacterium brumae DSM 44177]UWW07564.1 redoxin domain-containing protein [Mycolicibacterium brumae]
MTYLLVGFVGGFLAAISPCVLPVLPVVLLGGATGPDADGAVATRTRTWLRPVAVVAGLTLSFSLVTLFGALLLRLQRLPPDLLRWMGIAALAILGVAMLAPGVERLLERPFALIPQARVENTGAGSGFALGLALGVVYVPCAGPVLAAIAIAGASGEVGGQVVALTLGFAVGTAIPLLAIALAGSRLRARTRFLATHARGVRAAAGVAMIALAVALALNVTDLIARTVPDYTKTIGAALPSAAVAAPRVSGTGALEPCLDDALRGAAKLTDCGPAPEFAGISEWIDSPPLTLAGLRGKVVLVDFWAYSCVNCQRELPHVQDWYRTYAPFGFQVVGVHTPEYAFERDPDNITAGAKRLGLTFPIAVDNDYATWKAYQNIAWPAGYLIDANGVIRLVNFGEGRYAETERDIRALLTAAQPGVALPEPSGMTDPAPADRRQTHEIYLGAQRARDYAGSDDGGLTEGTRDFTAADPPPLGEFSLTGQWSVGGESLTAGRDAVITLSFHAATAYLNVSGEGALTATEGSHISRLPVGGAPNIYPVAEHPGSDDRVVSVAVSPGLSVYSFTFG